MPSSKCVKVLLRKNLHEPAPLINLHEPAPLIPWETGKPDNKKAGSW